MVVVEVADLAVSNFSNTLATRKDMAGVVSARFFVHHLVAEGEVGISSVTVSKRFAL